jgi:type II secretory pathway predicted ATPase ExeA
MITMEASRGETTAHLLSRIIGSYDEKPLRIAEARTRQIEALFMGTIRKKKKIAIIINNAELLSLAVLRALKLLRETMSQENAWPGVILLGETEKIIHIVKKDKGIAAASVRISDTGFIALNI